MKSLLAFDHVAVDVDVNDDDDDDYERVECVASDGIVARLRSIGLQCFKTSVPVKQMGPSSPRKILNCLTETSISCITWEKS